MVESAENLVINGIMIRITEQHPLREMLQERREHAEAGKLPEAPAEYEWQWWDGAKYQTYPAGIQMVIEAARQKQEPKAFFHIGQSSRMYSIDFATMKQFNFIDEKHWRIVRRLEGKELTEWRNTIALCLVM